MARLGGPRKAIMVIVRHGETDRNVGQERVRGWDNIDLNKKGYEQAEAVGKKLAMYRIDRIYSSDLKRAYETAKAIQRLNRTTPPPPVVKTRSLRPWNLGDFQGQPYAQVKPVVEAYQAKTPLQSVPGGESFHHFMARYMGFLMGKLKEAERGKLIVFVAHTRNMRGFKAWCKAGLRNDLVDVQHMINQQDAPTGGAALCEVNGDNIRITEL